MTDASPTAKDEWGTDAGLLSDYEGVIVDAWFGTQPNYMDGKVLLFQAKMATDDAENPEWTESWPCGPDWASYDGGATAEHPKAADKRFNPQTAYAGFYTRAMTLIREAGKEDELRSRGGPKKAAIWLGTKWFMEAVEESFNVTDREEGSETKGQKVTRTRTRNFPTKFLGFVQVQEGSTSGNTGSTPAATSPSATTADPLATLSAPTTASMKVLANSLPYDQWVDKVLELDEVQANMEVVALLSDDTLYKTMKEG